MRELAIIGATAAAIALVAHTLLGRRSSSRPAPPDPSHPDARGPAALGFGYDTSTPESDPSILGAAGASYASSLQAAALATAAGDGSSTIDYADPGTGA